MAACTTAASQINPLCTVGTAERRPGHSLTIDSGWRAVADDCLSWLAKQEL